MTAPDPALRVGEVLDGRYRLDALLGQGGMGAVFRAYHLAMERRVAVKVLRPHLVGDETAARRFAREARGTFKVESAHAVKVIDFAVADDGTLYMVMEYLDGRTVGAELAVDGPLGLRRAVHVARQIGDALGAAHRINLVHRDIKPENVLLQVRGSDSDFAKVLDFGLARIADDAASGPFSRLALTQGDMVFGTPDYMSPEQAKGQPLDGRSDLYALGTTLFEMITGRCPFVEPSAILLLARHVQTPPPHLWDVVPELAAQPGAAEVDAVIQRCLAKPREQRPASAEALIAELDAAARALDGRGPRPAPSAASTMDLAAPATSARDDRDRRPRRGRSVDAEPDSEAVAPVRPARAPWIVAIAVAAAVVAIAVIAIAPGAPRSGATGAAPARDAGAPIATAAVDARPAAANAGPAIDAGVRPPPPDRAAPRPPDRAPVRDPRAAAAEPHLAAAAQARTAGNRLRQLAEADLALRADPRSAEAKFLLGDALATTGDLENGCRYLRAVKRRPGAAAAATAAGCPAD